MSNSPPSLVRRVVDFLLGFFGTAAFFLLAGLAAVAVLTQLRPDWPTAVADMSLIAKLASIAPGFIIGILAACVLWRSRRFVAIGILCYMVLDLSSYVA